MCDLKDNLKKKRIADTTFEVGSRSVTAMNCYCGFVCFCLVLFACTLTSNGHRYKGPSGCFYNIRSCKAKCCGNGKTCESTAYRGKTWYKCVTVDCGSLSNPAHGSVRTLGGTTFESLATYTCEDGFVLSPTASRTCLSSGLWSFAAPTCQPSLECLPIQCGPLDEPCNGHVEYGRAIGDIATYSCEDGYELEGEPSRVCLDGGEWESLAPCCIKTCRQMEAYSGSYVNSSYKIIVDDLMPWDEAQAHCREDGAFLVEIDDAGEAAHVSSIFPPGYSFHAFWIGGTDRFEEGAWLWASDNRPFTYTAWEPEKPSGEPDYHCACFVDMNHKTWRDRDCTDAYKFVCECPLL